MGKKHFKNRIRVLNDHQATKDPNFSKLPLGTDRSWNYGHAKNMFVYIADQNSEITVGFKAFLTSYSIDITYNIETSDDQLEGKSFYDTAPGFKYKVALDVPAISLNDAKVNSSRIEALAVMMQKSRGIVGESEEKKYVLMGNLVQNGNYIKHKSITKFKDVQNKGVPCYINKFKYDIDVEMGFFEDGNKLWPKNYKFDLEILATTMPISVDGVIVEGVLANSNGATTSRFSHREISKYRSWPFGVKL